MTAPLVDRSAGNTIPASDHNDVKDYIEDGAYRVNTLSLNIQGTEIIDSSRNINAVSLLIGGTSTIPNSRIASFVSLSCSQTTGEHIALSADTTNGTPVEGDIWRQSGVGVRYYDGTNNRNVLTKAADFVVSTGEDGDYIGATESAIQDAITAATALSRTAIIVVKGSYTISNPITLDDDITLDLRGAKLTLANAADDDIIQANTKSRCRIIGGYLDADYSNQTPGSTIGCIDFVSCTDCVIEGVYATNGDVFGIRTTNGSKNLIDKCIAENSDEACLLLNNEEDSRITNCVGRNMRAGGVNPDGLIAVHQSSASTTNCIVSNCLAYGSAVHGINIEKADKTIVVGCQVYDNAGQGIQVIDSDNSIIDSCLVEGNTGVGVNITSGNHVQIKGCTIVGTTDDGIRLAATSAVTDIQITSCEISGGSAEGIDIDGTNDASSSDIIVNGCFIEGNEGPGVFLREADDVLITGCFLKDNTGAADEGQIYCEGNNVTISGNQIIESGGTTVDGIRLGEAVRKFNISGNTISANSGHGIQIRGADGTRIDGNVSGNVVVGNTVDGIYAQTALVGVTIIGNTTSENVYGINLADPASQTDVSIINNQGDGNSSGGIRSNTGSDYMIITGNNYRGDASTVYKGANGVGATGDNIGVTVNTT